MKKNRMMRLASILLVCVLLSTSVISGTFAKYTSTTTATGSATVAKWDVKLNTKSFSETITFDFTETWTDSNGSVEADVVSKRLAPGTKGSFNLVVKNDSEVNAQFKITFDFAEVSGLPLVITYKIGEDTYTADSFVAIGMNETKTVTVNWVWPFDGTNDTTFGEATDRDFDVSATVVVEQVD